MKKILFVLLFCFTSQAQGSVSEMDCEDLILERDNALIALKQAKSCLHLTPTILLDTFLTTKREHRLFEAQKYFEFIDRRIQRLCFDGDVSVLTETVPNPPEKIGWFCGF